MSSRLILSKKELFPKYINDFNNKFKDYTFPDLKIGSRFDFRLDFRSRKKKFNPLLQLARPEDAKEIAEIFKDAYDGTYPYKEFEDEREIHKLITNINCLPVIWKDDSNHIVAFVLVRADLKERKGYFSSLVLKKQYHGSIDVLRAFIGTVAIAYYTFREKIFLWYGETRTAHKKAQYITLVCGLYPIAFLPNKEIISNDVESGLLHVIYDKKALRKYRQRDYPKIIPEVINCFLYSNKKYKLGPVEFKHPKIELDQESLSKIKKEILIKEKDSNPWYNSIIFSVDNSNSYFKFVYTIHLRNIEKISYYVNNLEELFVFIQELKDFMRKKSVRYLECYVSAYEPSHQKMFYDAGFLPRGYIPSWKYNNQLKLFEDYIIFNYFQGKINNNIALVPEGAELIEALGIRY